MTLREWCQSVGLTRADLAEPSRLRIVRKKSVAGRLVFLMPENARSIKRPRAMLAALEARYPSAVAPVVQGEPVGTRFVRTCRRIYVNFPAIKSALRMELVDA
jgi:hypothetical protein